MAISFNEYLIKDALYLNLTHKHTRDRDFATQKEEGAPFGSKKTIYLLDSTIVPYPANAIENTNNNSAPELTNFIYEQSFDVYNAVFTIDDNGTRGDARDDKIYFNQVLFTATRSAKIDWFMMATEVSAYRDIVVISDSVGPPGTNSLLTVSTSTVSTGQSIICWFNLSIV